jgi:hypothetical protein
MIVCDHQGKIEIGMIRRKNLNSKISKQNIMSNANYAMLNIIRNRNFDVDKVWEQVMSKYRSQK